jgi:Peptidase family C25/CARDB
MNIKIRLSLGYLIIIVTALFLTKTNTYSQTNFGNEWIVYDQPYIKLSINKNGIYKISKAELKNAGWNLENINPKNMQLYFRGKEMAIFIDGEDDNVFNENDYVEFYAITNNGSQDEEVYRPKSARTNKYLSLYSNETAYFLTISNKNKGKRVVENTFFDSNLNNERIYYSKKLKVFEDDWNFDITTAGAPELQNSFFEPYESLVSNRFRFQVEPINLVDKVNLKNYSIGDEIKINFEALLGSRNYPKKTISVTAGSEENKLSLENFNTNLISFQTSSKSEDIDLKLFIESSNTPIIIDDKKQDAFSVLYYLIKYPTKPIYIENSEYETLPNLNDKSLLRLSSANENIVGFSITDLYNQKKLKTNFNKITNDIDIFIENTRIESNIALSSIPNTPYKIEQIRFNKIEIAKVDYVIITDNSLLNGAMEYSKYRESQIGGSNKVYIKSKQDIYNEFCFGERNPIAIHRFADFMTKNSKVKNLLLLGKALSYPRLFKSNEKDDLVPSFGYPASDALLTAGLNGYNIDVQAIPTGRVSATTNQEVLNYLEKVKSFEANAIKGSWNKNFLQLGGGKGEYQVNDFKAFLARLGKIAEKSKLGSKYQMINKAKINDGVENIDISQQINNGIGMVTFFGHSSSSTLDLDIGFASDEKANFKNGPLYPFMFFNGCGAGNVFNTYTSLSKDWLLTPNKGAIAILAHSFLSFSNSNMDYMEKLYSTWFSSTENLNLSLGALVQKVAEIQIKENPGDLYTMANVHEMVLQGDPAIHIFNMTKPDFHTEDGQLFLTSTQKNKTVAEGDSVKLGIIVSNYGIYEAGTKVNLNIQKTFADGKKVDLALTIKAVAYQDTIYVPLKKDLNLTSITVSVDSDSKVDEMDEANNTGNINFNWVTLKNTDYYSTAKVVDIVNPNLSLKLEGKTPINGMEVALNPVLEISLIDENDLVTKTDKLTVSYRKICDGCPETLQKLDLGTITGAPNEILTKINLKGLSLGEYELFVQGFDAKKNASGAVYSFTFKIVENTEGTSVKVFPNPMTLYTTFEIGVSGLDGLGTSNYSLNIYDQKGVIIKAMTGNLQSGINNVYWDSKDNGGNATSPGVYIYKMLVNKNGKAESKGGKISLVN